MRSVAHLDPSLGKYAAVNADQWTLGEQARESWGRVLAKALALGVSLIGMAAGVMLVFAVAHEGWR